MCCVCTCDCTSPTSPATVDWVRHYPDFEAKEGEEAVSGGITKCVQALGQEFAWLSQPLTTPPPSHVVVQAHPVPGHRVRVWRFDG